MKNHHAIAALTLTAFFLAGCAHGAIPVPSAPGAATAKSRGTLTMTIAVPAQARANTRAPKYVSPSTQSLAASFDGGPSATYNLSPSDPGCVAATQTMPLTCSFSVSLSAGNHLASLSTFDGQNGTGKVLSTNGGVPVTVLPGQANTLLITLNGIVSRIALSLSNPAPLRGEASTTALNVNAYDADGNLIVGPGSYSNGPITLTDSDSSGATLLSTTSVSDPSVAVTISYNGAAITGGSATFTAGAPGVGTGASQPAVLTPGFLAHWLERAGMPFGSEALAATASDGFVLASGGYSGDPGGNSITNVASYAAAPNSWQNVTAMLEPRDAHAFVAVNSTIYAIGGDNTVHGVLSSMEAAAVNPDGTIGSWAEQPPMPTARTSISAAAIGSMIYVPGGFNSRVSGALNTLEVYDTVAGTWSEKAVMPQPLGVMAVAAANGILYVAGGTTVAGEAATNTLFAYDPVSDTWTTRAPMPTARYGAAAASYDGFIYVIGGYDGAGQYLQTVEIYDPASDTWTEGTPMPTARQNLGAAAISGGIYAVGGTTGGFYNTNEELVP